MANTLYGNTVWEGLSTDGFPTYADGARDGHFLKQLDTGESYIRVLSDWQFINLGLSFIKATKSGSITTNAGGAYHVTFTTPFISADYTVALSCHDLGAVKPPIAFFSNITATGFDIQTRDSKKGNPFGSVVVSWVATRSYNP
jgi:hypothetical protein